MRYENFGEMSTDDGHKVYFSGEEGRHEYGVGFFVHKDVVDAVLGCRRWRTQGLFQWRRGQTWVWGWIFCAQGRSGCCFRMPASLQQTDISPPESSSLQYHHRTGLCTNIWSWWQRGRPLLPATPGNHRPNTKDGHSGLTRGFQC